jgi:hypothetical protein
MRAALTRRADTDTATLAALAATILAIAMGSSWSTTLRAAPGSAERVPLYAAKRVTPAQAEADAVRLLEQATWGPNDALVAHMMSVGAAKFLDEQFATGRHSPAGSAPGPRNSPPCSPTSRNSRPPISDSSADSDRGSGSSLPGLAIDCCRR